MYICVSVVSSRHNSMVSFIELPAPVYDVEFYVSYVYLCKCGE